MKKVLILVFISVFANITQAATAINPFEVCVLISQQNTSNGQACQQVVSAANYVSPVGSAICASIINNNGASANAVQCMKNIADKYYENDPADVCIAAANKGGASSNIALCALNGAGKTFRQGELSLCLNLANNGSASARVAQCVADSGRTYTGPVEPIDEVVSLCPTNQELIRTLRQVRSFVEIGGEANRRKALRELDTTISDLRDCP